VRRQSFSGIAVNVERMIAVVSALCAVVAIVASIYTPELHGALQKTYVLSVRGYTVAAVGLVALGILLSLFVWSRSTVRQEREKVRNSSLMVDALNGELRHYREKVHVDVVTGIPNQLKLQEDVVDIVKQITAATQYQAIMLDLDGFGQINDRFGYHKGDLVIRYIAQSIYNTMRRNEEAYKRPFAGDVANDDLWRRIYRKYSGGDEFVFIVVGGEDEALGFLLRMKRRFEQELSKHVGAILGEPWSLVFHAGVCHLNHNDTFETLVSRVEECLRLARQKGSVSRVFWMSRKSSADCPPGSILERTYRDAEQQFRT
jgi:diguanylate cyclase (GGDEF)-like protein